MMNPCLGRLVQEGKFLIDEVMDMTFCCDKILNSDRCKIYHSSYFVVYGDVEERWRGTCRIWDVFLIQVEINIFEVYIFYELGIPVLLCFIIESSSQNLNTETKFLTVSLRFSVECRFGH